MKGSIQFHKQRGYFYVAWPKNGKVYKIYRYNGEFMYGRKIADKLLAVIQGEEERGVLDLNKYLKAVRTDVIDFLKDWLKTETGELSPATQKDYSNSVTNHLIPWFKDNPYNLHEIQYDALMKLMRGIKREGKGKLNVMYCLHSALLFAQKSGRIPSMPLFPEKKHYKIREAEFRWLPEDRQIKVIQAIPVEHQPIFWWLKYHLRRPGEAMALYRSDYKVDADMFVIQRAFSNKKMHNFTKTRVTHYIACHPEFREMMKAMRFTDSPYFFVNPNGRLDGQHYQHDYLVDLWNAACKKVGEDIPLYKGTKHSSCTQYINEKGLSIDQLQMLTDHARRESVTKYAKVMVDTQRELFCGKSVGRVLPFKTQLNQQ